MTTIASVRGAIHNDSSLPYIPSTHRAQIPYFDPTNLPTKPKNSNSTQPTAEKSIMIPQTPNSPFDLLNQKKTPYDGNDNDNGETCARA